MLCFASKLVLALQMTISLDNYPQREIIKRFALMKALKAETWSSALAVEEILGLERLSV